MYDNKVRLSKDVLDKAEVIASTWGLKNARAAVEAVFRRYADEYLSRGTRSTDYLSSQVNTMPIAFAKPLPDRDRNSRPSCEALEELDDLLGL